MAKAGDHVCESVVKHVEERGRQLSRVYHVPVEDLYVRYELSPHDDGTLVVQIRHAGHILEKVTVRRGDWEK